MSPRVSRSSVAGRGCSCPGAREASFSRTDREALVVLLDGRRQQPFRPIRSADHRQRLAPSPRKRTRAPGGPADRVERSSPALRSLVARSWKKESASQTGVPPPHTGQCEMKPSRWADTAELAGLANLVGLANRAAGPPGVSSRICGCQGAGSLSIAARTVLRAAPGCRLVGQW
jgi:hypothetical protein